MKNSINGFFKGLIQNKENFPQYIAKSFKELNTRNKLIIILLVILIVMGNITKLINGNKRKREEDYDNAD